MLRVRVRYEDAEGRSALKKSGFHWNPLLKLWEGQDTFCNRELLEQFGLNPEPPDLSIATHSTPELDGWDEQQMRLELAHGLVGESEYIYDIVKGSRRIVGVSWTGIKRLAKQCLPTLDMELVRIDQTEKWIRAIVKAKTERISALGAAQMPAHDPVSYSIAIDKAQRNAIMILLDEACIKQAIERYLRGLSPQEALESIAVQVL